MMADKEMAIGMPRIDHPNQLHKGYLVAKQTRLPFPTQANFRADKPLQLVHADLYGPITPVTLGGNKYFLLLVDDLSRWMWVYMIKEKSDALSTFNKYRALVEKASGHNIKILRTDCGGEFLSRNFTDLREDKGIEWHLTAPYTLQQNGVVERRNRTMMSTVRSLLKSMHVLAKL